MKPLLHSDSVHLLGRDALGKDGVEIKSGPDRLGGIGAITGDHDDTRYACMA
jgi:hypothetical protein